MLRPKDAPKPATGPAPVALPQLRAPLPRTIVSRPARIDVLNAVMPDGGTLHQRFAGREPALVSAGDARLPGRGRRLPPLGRSAHRSLMPTAPSTWTCAVEATRRPGADLRRLRRRHLRCATNATCRRCRNSCAPARSPRGIGKTLSSTRSRPNREQLNREQRGIDARPTTTAAGIDAQRLRHLRIAAARRQCDAGARCGGDLPLHRRQRRGHGAERHTLPQAGKRRDACSTRRRHRRRHWPTSRRAAIVPDPAMAPLAPRRKLRPMPPAPAPDPASARAQPDGERLPPPPLCSNAPPTTTTITSATTASPSERCKPLRVTGIGDGSAPGVGAACQKQVDTCQRGPTARRLRCGEAPRTRGARA